MKVRLLSLLFLMSFVSPITVTYLVLKHQKKAIKKEVKWKMIEGIPEQELVLLSFSSHEIETELNWKHSREFEYQGEWYDIVKSEKNGDTTNYWCWWDHEETKLSKQLSKILVVAIGQNPRHSDSKNTIISYFKSLFLSEPFSWKPFARQTKLPNCEKQKHYFTYYQQVSAPPPKQH